jgi:hypothetical protein
MVNRHAIILVLAFAILCIVAPASADDPFFDASNQSPEEVSKEAVLVPPLQLSQEEIAYYRQRLEQAMGMRKAIWLVDDFEDGNINGWNNPFYPIVYCLAQAVSPGAGSSSTSLRIDGACGHFAGRYYDVGGWNPTGIDFYLRSAATNKHDGYIVFGDDDITTNNGIIYFLADGWGSLSLVSDGWFYNCGAYNAYQWYRISFTVDWDCKVVDVYVDGVLKHRDVPFRSPGTTEITKIHIYNFDSSSAWWDEISMSTGPPSMSIFYDDFERGATCHWDVTVY